MLASDRRMTVVCAGCGDPIAERTLLSALDRFWHISCLNCSYCGLRLDELGPSVFVRSNMLLCRHDYIKLFGLTGTCAKCRVKILPDELVMRCQDHVYHVNCFICFQCHAPLHPGDKVCPVNGSLFCEHEFPQLFANASKWSALKLTQPMTKSRPIPGHDALMKGNETIHCSPNYSDTQNLNNMTYSLITATQPDLSAVINAHANSPNINMFNPTSGMNDHSPLSSSTLGLPDVDPSFNPDSLGVSAISSEKHVRNSDNPTTGRKKQKKVDSRRCPPLRVC